MEENYPGNLDCKVIYELNNNNELLINFQATTDQDTLVNLTNHNYWNFHGHGVIIKIMKIMLCILILTQYVRPMKQSIPNWQSIKC